MAQKYFAMDFAFYSTMGVYSFRDCCEITRAVGYDAMLLSIWDGRNWAQATEMETMKSRYGVEPAGVYVASLLKREISLLRAMLSPRSRVFRSPPPSSTPPPPRSCSQEFCTTLS